MKSLTIQDVLTDEKFIMELLKRGLLIGGGKGCGKTNAMKVVLSLLMRNKSDMVQVKVFDTALNLRWDFEDVLFQKINEGTRFVYNGKEHILFDTNLIEQADLMKFMGKVVLKDYLSQYALKEEVEGNTKLMRWYLYGLEETQSSLDRYSLMRKEGKLWLKMVSEGRNFNQSFLVVGQRLANISTSLVERIHAYMFGKMTGDNDIAKLKRIVGKNSKILDEIKKLEVNEKAGYAEFIYYDGSSSYIFKIPKYNNLGKKPKEWKPKPIEIPTVEYLEGVRKW